MSNIIFPNPFPNCYVGWGVLVNSRGSKTGFWTGAVSKISMRDSCLGFDPPLLSKEKGSSFEDYYCFELKSKSKGSADYDFWGFGIGLSSNENGSSSYYF